MPSNPRFRHVRFPEPIKIYLFNAKSLKPLKTKTIKAITELELDGQKSYAFCSVDDKFVKKIGSSLAASRMLNPDYSHPAWMPHDKNIAMLLKRMGMFITDINIKFHTNHIDTYVIHE